MTAWFDEVALPYLLLANATGFLVMGLDKLEAVQNDWRIPERWFLIICLAGGALGIFLGMFIFHHKTNKTSFLLFVIMTLALYIGILMILPAEL